MAKERLVSEIPEPTNGDTPAPKTPARLLFDRYQGLLRFEANRKWIFFPLERIEFCKPISNLR